MTTFPRRGSLPVFLQESLSAGGAEALVRMRELLPPTLQRARPYYRHTRRPELSIMHARLHPLSF